MMREFESADIDQSTILTMSLLQREQMSMRIAKWNLHRSVNLTYALDFYMVLGARIGLSHTPWLGHILKHGAYAQSEYLELCLKRSRDARFADNRFVHFRIDLTRDDYIDVVASDLTLKLVDVVQVARSAQ